MLDCPEYTPIRNNNLNLITERLWLFSKHYREVDVICQATLTFSIGNFSVSHIFAKELLKSNHIYIRVSNNNLNLITERFPGLAFLELSPFDKMQFLIGDVSFSLDTNSGLFLDKIGKTMLQQSWNSNKFDRYVCFPSMIGKWA
jgi:hypothetical protein